MGGMQRLLLQNGTLMQRWNYNEQGQTQLLGMYKTPSGGPNETLMKLTLGYGTATENNGNVRSQAITVGSFVASQSYDYDRWSRLKVAQEGSNWRQEFGYDRWGNRWMVTAGTSGIPIPAGTPSGTALDAGNWFSPATNRIVYSEDSGANPPNPKTDKAGNQSFDGDWRNRYDVENRIARVELPGTPVTVAGAYEYDGEGRRVKKTVGAASTTYVYDAAGQMMQEVQVGGTAAAGRSYLFQDHLGSTRLRVDASGVRQGWWDYAPFGEVVPATLGNRNSVAGGAYEGPRPKMLFTGKERDAETGLDYLGARYMSNAQGRFTSPDVPFFDQHPSAPQSWNLYAYVRSNPMVLIDPTGLGCVYANASGDGVESINNGIDSSECASTGGTWLPGTVVSANFNKKTGRFQAGSNDGTNVYYSSYAFGTTTAEDGSCVNGCTGFEISSASTDWLSSMIVGGNLDQMIAFMVGRDKPIHGVLFGDSMIGSIGEQILSGPLDFWNDRWAGPAGMGPPQGRGDWAAMVHDYNFNTNKITIGTYFNPSISKATARALIQSNNNLIRNAGGVQAAKMAMAFGVVNAFQWLTHLGRR
jgi:RHS repeat-associated protein